ncbi:MAG: trypsin-like peptidase domain-containing protein [Niastella sp.]|nr:trypsin-like peptidase domain-containing protein [Niastella sp.]
MEDSLLMDAVERFVKGEMSAQEKIYFEDLRKNNPELDQTVVEQIFFYNELEKYSDRKNFTIALHEVETKLSEEGIISRNLPKGKGKLIQLWARSKRTIAVAASIAGVVSLFIASLVTSVAKQTPTNIKPLVEKLNQQENKTRQIENKLNKLEAGVNTPIIKPRLDAKFRATGFMIDAVNNYIVTNAHVIDQAKHKLIIENNKGEQFNAHSIYVNPEMDLAIIKVDDHDFPKMATLPYTIKKTNAELGEQVFMLGFPKQEVVYGEGYISARNGYQMDTIFCQLSTSANEGNSGSPVINKNGELVGVINSLETNADGVVFAIKAVNINRAIAEVKKIKGNEAIAFKGSNALKGNDRVNQIKKLQDYVFMIKGN